MRREHDGIAFLNIPQEKILHSTLEDRIEIDERFVDESESWLMQECLGEHELLTRPAGEILAEHPPLVLEIKQLEPGIADPIRICEIAYLRDEMEIFFRGEEARRSLLFW